MINWTWFGKETVLEDLRKSTENLSVTGVLAEILTKDFPSKTRERYYLRMSVPLLSPTQLVHTGIFCY